MPITKGAAKTMRADQNKRQFNIRRASKMRGILKDIKKDIASGDTKKAEGKVPEAYKAIDKAAKRGIIKKNTAARKKSRLIASIKRNAK